MVVGAAWCLWGVALLTCGLADARQMCWSCQFVLNGSGQECVSTPSNWTGGEPRLKCPYRCVLMAEFDAGTGQPTFFHRGCGTSDGEKEDGCSDNGSRHSCFFSCGDGHDYCNDKPLPRSPLLEEKRDNSHAALADISPKTLVGLVVMATYLVGLFNRSV